MSFNLLMDELRQAATKKSQFLDRMNEMIPWCRWVEAAKPCYYKGERGQKPYELELMLRIYVLQYFYQLADEAVAMEVTDSRAFSVFCGVETMDQIPSGITIGRFRHRLIKHQLQDAFLNELTSLLRSKSLLLRKGNIVESSLARNPVVAKTRQEKNTWEKQLSLFEKAESMEETLE